MRTPILVFLATILLAPAVGAQVTMASNPHGEFPTGLDCSSCHTAAGWKTIKAKPNFDHGKTRFPLTGRHAATACARCHLSLKFDEPKVSEAQCTSCHADIHRGAMTGDCVRCHNTSSFRDVPAVAVHARTAFPLTGAHLQAPCESCHRTEQGGAYAAVSRDCYSCHRARLAVAAQSIDHSGFGTDCSQCHSPFSWSGGTQWDHVTASRGFQLVEFHAQLRCTSCHVMPGNTLKFSPAPAGNTDCIACHQADSQRAHGGGFPSTCADCHNQTSWGGANFDHDGQFFPINSGAHRGTSCTTCHTVPGNYKSFTCLSCHAHDKGTTDSRHGGVRNYVYDSVACYQCHRSGRAG